MDRRRARGMFNSETGKARYPACLHTHWPRQPRISPAAFLRSSTKTRLAHQSQTYRVLNRITTFLVPKSLETVRVVKSNRIVRNAATRFGLHPLIATTGGERQSRRSSVRTSDNDSINDTTLLLLCRFSVSQHQRESSLWRIRLQCRSLWG